jgi:hypothetical protein
MKLNSFTNGQQFCDWCKVLQKSKTTETEIDIFLLILKLKESRVFAKINS